MAASAKRHKWSFNTEVVKRIELGFDTEAFVTKARTTEALCLYLLKQLRKYDDSVPVLTEFEAQIEDERQAVNAWLKERAEEERK